MRRSSVFLASWSTLLTASLYLGAQQMITKPGETVVATPAALAASKENVQEHDRGARLYNANCGSCHGYSAKGTPRGDNLIRSMVVIRDEKGSLIGPVLRTRHPKTGPAIAALTEPQIQDIATWLRVQFYAADHRVHYAYQMTVTGDAKKGEAFFNGAGGCKGCHTPDGDLKGIGGRYALQALQTRWVNPRGARGGNADRKAIRVTVTPVGGKPVTGTLDRIDDFLVTLRDASGEFHSFARDVAAPPKVEIADPLQAHKDLLRKYSDDDIHNVTAYLVTMK